MDTNASILAVLLCILITVVGGFLVIRATIKEAIYLPATSDDWYIIFDVDSERKHLLLLFYPVIALVHRNGHTTALTSRPGETEAIALRRGAGNRVGLVPMPTASSATSGNWFRGGVMIDAYGTPSSPQSRDFREIIAMYRAHSFEIELRTPVPLLYQGAIDADPLSG